MTAPAVARPTACLALADGTLFYGTGFGATGETTAELCFNTAMTGYQEIMTDPSYAGQIVTFTFPISATRASRLRMTKPAILSPRAWSSNGTRPTPSTGVIRRA